MAIDIFAEEMVTMRQAAKRLPRPRGTKPLHMSTMWRWSTAGLKAKDGQIVRLESVRIGGTVCTSIEAMRRFFDRLQEPDTSVQPSERLGGFNQQSPASLSRTYGPRATAERQRQLDEVSRSLDFDFFGCNRIVEESGCSEGTLREIFDRLCVKLPPVHLASGKAYDTVRRAIFRRAVEILQGLHGSPKGLKAAKAWIDSLDPKTLDVAQLKGCGPHTAGEWKGLVEKGVLNDLHTELPETGG